MGLIANILDFRATKRLDASDSLEAPAATEGPGYARLIPGISRACINNGSPDERSEGSVARSALATIYAECLPRFLGRFRAVMLFPLVLDTTLILLAFLLESWAIQRPLLNPSVLCLYVLSFVAFSINEEVYSQTGIVPQTGAQARALIWASLFAGFCATRIAGSSVPVLALSAGSFLALLGRRRLRTALRPANANSRNVLIIGSGGKVQRIAEAIRHDRSSHRLVVGVMAENHLRNVYGPSMFSRIAREEFVDEVIVASADPVIGEISVREAKRNALDLRVLPDICVLPVTGEIAFESIGGIPLLRIQDHQSPEYGLILKRAFDMLGAAAGLVVLSPVFLVIALLIKLDSFGPVFYGASRIGTKGRGFSCYKFRTMVRNADELKPLLRKQNERDGAFFKLTNDPRVTRIGQLLRRYSLDELPQLWNVLRGEMSLVGPRPHPPDDVDQYELRHLQRLDFVPGITGLWQVTARQDPSFERSVELDIEYIKSWNLWLDARILWRTLFAVMQGSGA